MLRIRNASQLVVVCSNGETMLKGGKQNEIEILKNASMIIDQKSGRIKAIYLENTVESERYSSERFEVDINASGKSVIPGLVDGHTHAVWTGDRCHEFEMKLQGATYMDIHKAGGGIGFTVKKVRESSAEELMALLRKRLDLMLKNGTTLVEVKSGYGLNLESELKMLEVLHRCRHPVEIVSNYLGAHSVPKMDHKSVMEYTDEIVNVHLPKIAECIREGLISPTFIDVFHEKGVFEYEETKKILKAGKNIAGLEVNFHGDELNENESGILASEVGAVAVSHLEKITEKEMETMAAKCIVGTLLPTTAYILRLEYPPCRKMIEKQIPIALGSDFNPNAHCLSMPFIMNLACVQMKMTLSEALVAATLNAAASLLKSKTHGSLEVGKVGDCVVIDADNWQHIIYEMVDSPILYVIKAGKIVYSNQK